MARGSSKASSEAPATPVGEKLSPGSVQPPKTIPKGKVLSKTVLPDGTIEYALSTKEYPYVIGAKYPDDYDQPDRAGKWVVTGQVGDLEKAQKFVLTQKGKRNADIDMTILKPTHQRREDA